MPTRVDEIDASQQEDAEPTSTSTSARPNRLSTRGRRRVTNKAPDWSAQELAILGQSWMIASEDSLNGTSQKGEVFWMKILNEYNQRLGDVEKKTNADRRTLKLRELQLLNGTMPLNQEAIEFDRVEYYRDRSWKNLRDKWQRSVLPNVNKMVTIMDNVELPSGTTDEEEKWQFALPIFKRQEGIDFDKYILAYKYLHKKSRFVQAMDTFSARMQARMSQANTPNTVNNTNSTSVANSSIEIDAQEENDSPLAGVDFTSSTSSSSSNNLQADLDATPTTPTTTTTTSTPSNTSSTKRKRPAGRDTTKKQTALQKIIGKNPPSNNAAQETMDTLVSTVTDLTKSISELVKARVEEKKLQQKKKKKASRKKHLKKGHYQTQRNKDFSSDEDSIIQTSSGSSTSTRKRKHKVVELGSSSSPSSGDSSDDGMLR